MKTDARTVIELLTVLALSVPAVAATASRDRISPNVGHAKPAASDDGGMFAPDGVMGAPAETDMDGGY